MKMMTKLEREAVAKWTEENNELSDEAGAFWSLMSARGYIEETIALAGMSPKLRELDNAWWGAREELGRRCLAAMKKAKPSASSPPRQPR